MAKAENMTFNSSTIADGLIARIEGEIDFSRSPVLRTQLIGLLTNGCPRLVVDLSGVPYMDSSGVATLVEALNIQRRKGHRLVLCGLQPKVRGIFEIARLDMVFTIAPDANAASGI